MHGPTNVIPVFVYTESHSSWI